MQHPIFEPLESRQFLSAAPCGVGDMGIGCVGEPVIMAAATEFHLTDIIGKWKGTIQTNLRPRPFKATVNITSVTAAGKIKGTVSVPFLLSNYKFNIDVRKSSVKSDGTFTVKFNKFGVSGQFKGHYDDANKHVSGDFNAKYGAKSAFGTFDFKRIR